MEENYIWEEWIMRVLITGTSSGIGREIADKFLEEGHTVTGIDGSEESNQHNGNTHNCIHIRD